MNDTGYSTFKIVTAPAGRGFDWLIDAFGLFQKNWLLWLGIEAFLIFMMLCTAFIPLGSLVLQILLPVIFGGLMLGCKAADQDDGFAFEHVFSGFNNAFGRLLAIGLIHFTGSLIIILISIAILVILMGGYTVLMDTIGSIFTATGEVDTGKLTDLAPDFILLVLVAELCALALYLPLLMLVWFAPALVVLDDQGTMESLKNSFAGCVKNVIPYLIYGIVGLILTILATIPLGLGWFVLTPMIIASVYLAYKDIYITSE